MAIVLTPYIPLAFLAAARPPLPPPMTKKSHSLGTGAMIEIVLEKCRVKSAARRTVGECGDKRKYRNGAETGDSLD